MLFTVFQIPASAITETCIHGNRTFNDKQLTGGVGQYGDFRRYYYLVNVTGNDASPIEIAVGNWVNTTDNPGVTTSISIRETTTQSNSSFDVYNKAFSGGITGQTEFWTYSNKIDDPSASNWGWTKIFIDCSNKFFILFRF